VHLPSTFILFPYLVGGLRTRPRLPSNTRGYWLSFAEPYIDEDGKPSVVLIYNGEHIHFRTIEQWKNDEPEIGKYLEAAFFLDVQHWHYSSTPILPEDKEDVRKLHIDIQRCNEEYIEFPDSALPSVFATWIMGSYLVPLLPRSPVLQIYGPTESGKGQVLDQVDRLAYRGKKMLSPTSAVLYRLADQYSPTFALDELQDLDKESYRTIMTIVKGTYDSTPVYRCKDKSHDVEMFQTGSFVALSLKGSHPAEDIKNRGILITMRQNEHPRALVPSDDTEEHKNIRARLIGLRLKMLTDQAFAEEALRAVEERGTPEALGFDRRPRDIALSLLLPALLSGQEEELIDTIRKSTEEAKDENNSTMLATVQHSYERLSNEREGQYFPVSSIRWDVQNELVGEGELKSGDKLPSRKITNALKTLGYELVRRTGNQPYINRHSKHNIAAFETNRKKFPLNEQEVEES